MTLKIQNLLPNTIDNFLQLHEVGTKTGSKAELIYYNADLLRKTTPTVDECLKLKNVLKAYEIFATFVFLTFNRKKSDAFHNVYYFLQNVLNKICNLNKYKPYTFQNSIFIT